uniref:Immunoglobulin domain-containing protein n=1 Tax=Ornithorhynchus anatinus TaxID=9258 RepID=A0A6I8NE56_ORNAN
AHMDILGQMMSCFSLTDSKEVRSPGCVSGPDGGSFTMQCHYDHGWETYVKWWCRGADWNSCRIMVRTTGSESEQKNGSVSIRDNRQDCMITVTMENLRAGDADTYWCGIEKAGTDLGAHVVVTINTGKILVMGGCVLFSFPASSLSSLQPVLHCYPDHHSKKKSQLSAHLPLLKNLQWLSIHPSPH